MIETILAIVITISAVVAKLLPERAVSALLFGGEIRDEHKTKYVFKEITERYKDSIKAFNRTLTLNVGFAVIALYADLVLPPTGTVQLPFVGLSVSRQIWISLVPLVAYFLQILNFTAFVWFMLLRIGLKLLIKKPENRDDFGDATNVLLGGPLGHFWIILRIGLFFRTRWNYIWYVPAVILVLTVVLSPLLICLYFIVQLYITDHLRLGLAYSIFFVPYSVLFILLIGTASILGIGDWGDQANGDFYSQLKRLIETINEDR